MSDVVVKPHSRLHLTLVDLAGVTRRKYGGIGMMLRSPVTVVRARSSNGLTLNFPPSLEHRTQGEALAALTRLADTVGTLPVEISVDRHIPEHVGLGSKTALVLGILAAARGALSLKVSDEKLQRLSGRGGTSGVGIHGFFLGGCTVDCGQERSDADFEFMPSSASQPTSASLLTSRYEIPPEWRIHLLIPAGFRRTVDQELALFRNTTPIPGDEVLHTLALVYHGVVPAIMRADLGVLAESLARIHQVGFKLREVDAQSQVVRDLYYELLRLDLGPVGISSWGPTIYIITRAKAERSAEAISAIASSIPDCEYILTRGWNRGFELA